MREMMTVSEVARQISRQTGTDIRPRDISDLFYSRDLPETLAPIVGGRRLIDEKHLPLIWEALRERGKLDAGPKKGDGDAEV